MGGGVKNFKNGLWGGVTIRHTGVLFSENNLKFDLFGSFTTKIKQKNDMYTLDL